MPFIADDILVSFDEPRSEAGLALLGELGALTQVLLFTHHQHLVAYAERALGNAVRIIRL